MGEGEPEIPVFTESNDFTWFGVACILILLTTSFTVLYSIYEDFKEEYSDKTINYNDVIKSIGKYDLVSKLNNVIKTRRWSSAPAGASASAHADGASTVAPTPPPTPKTCADSNGTPETPVAHTCPPSFGRTLSPHPESIECLNSGCSNFICCTTPPLTETCSPGFNGVRTTIRVTATADYTPPDTLPENTYITATQGDVLEVSPANPRDGWIYVRKLTGETGYFPAAYTSAYVGPNWVADGWSTDGYDGQGNPISRGYGLSQRLDLTGFVPDGSNSYADYVLTRSDYPKFIPCQAGYKNTPEYEDLLRLYYPDRDMNYTTTTVVNCGIDDHLQFGEGCTRAPAAPCYIQNDANAMQFPDWYDQCADPNSADPNAAPTTCSSECAAVYTPWFNRCKEDTLISHLDSEDDKWFTLFSQTCASGDGGG